MAAPACGNPAPLWHNSIPKRRAAAGGSALRRPWDPTRRYDAGPPRFTGRFLTGKGMSLFSFSGLRADRLVAEIRESGDPDSPKARKALEKLKSAGAGAINPIIQALATADKRETVALVEALSGLVDNKTFPQLAAALTDENPRAVAGVAWALSTNRAYSPNLALDLLRNPLAPKTAVLGIIAAQKTRFSVRELLNAAYQHEPNERSALFKLIGDIVDESSVDELISRVEGKDPIARTHIIGILGKFNQPRVREALARTLSDPSKFVRSAALGAMAKMDGPVDPAQICRLLRDPELDVQNLAVEVLCRAKHPDTVKHLVEVLKDESEYARRAAVEVLNEVGDDRSVKFLLDAIKDADWWVRSRAADALGKIGGPRVINAALTLVNDKDDEVRRTAIEILNQTKDDRAVSHLIEATRDKDWWVAERAVDALAEIGSKRAVPRLMEMLQSGNAKALPIVVRAIGKLGDTQSADFLAPLLQRPRRIGRADAADAGAHVPGGDALLLAGLGADTGRSLRLAGGRDPRGDHVEAVYLRGHGCRARGADELHTGKSRQWAQLGLPLLLAARCLFRRAGAQPTGRHAHDGRLPALHRPDRRPLQQR